MRAHPATPSTGTPIHSTSAEGNGDRPPRAREAEPSSAEDRYRQLFDGMAQGAFEQLADGSLVDVNPAALAIFGLTREEFLGRTSYSPQWDVIDEHGAPVPATDHPSMRALATGRPGNGVTLGVRNARTGERVWVEVHARPVFAAGGSTPTRVLATLHEVTRRRLAEERYRDIVQTSMDAYWLADPAGRLLDVNAALSVLTGYDREQLLGMGIADLEAAEDPAEVAAHMQRIRETGMDRFETRLRHRDSHVIDVEVVVQHRREENHHLVFLRDISARRRDERIHAARLVLLEQAATGTLDDVMTATLDQAEVLTGSCIGFYHFLDEDQRTLRLQAWSTRTMRDFCRAEGKGQHYAVGDAGVWVDCVRQRRTVIHNDYASAPNRRGMPPGHAQVIRLMSVPVFRDGRIVAVMGVGNSPADYTSTDVKMIERLADIGWDIAQRKRAEEDRARLERQMEQAQRLESLGVLAGGIAHDFNNLLTGVLGHADLAGLTLPPDAPERENLAAIVVAARRAAELCEQMLAYSGRGQVRIVPVDLRRLVGETLALVRSSISKQARLELDLDEVPLTLLGDPAQVRQVVMNLVINASEAIGEQPGTITIRARALQVGADDGAAEASLGPGRYVSLDVGDTGCGMDAATLERIYDPFFTTKFTGRGLGLSAVRGIVRGHRGSITARSTPGAGTTFRVLFPWHEVPAPAAGPPTAAPAAVRGGGLALVVDDEEPVRVVAARMLERLGLTPLVAASGEEAVAVNAAHAGHVRVALLDLTMPGLASRETLAQMRRADPALPVVLMSGYSEADVGQRFAGVPLAGVMQKPFAFEQLAALVGALPQRTG